MHLISTTCSSSQLHIGSAIVMAIVIIGYEGRSPCLLMSAAANPACFVTLVSANMAASVAQALMFMHLA